MKLDLKFIDQSIHKEHWTKGVCWRLMFCNEFASGSKPILKALALDLLEVRTKYNTVERKYMLSFICFNLAWLYSVTIFKWSKSRMGSRGLKMNVMNFSLWSKLMQGHCTPFTHSQPSIGVALDYKWKLIHWIPNDWVDIV